MEILNLKRVIFIISVLLILVILFSHSSYSKDRKHRIPERGFISSNQARTWEEGLISGNGTIGTNALSHPLNETIIFSHERLFLPKGPPHMPPDNSARLFEIRRLIDRELYKQATELAFNLSNQEGFMYPDPFVPAFDMNIQMEPEGKIKDYLRSVNFQTGEASVYWRDHRGEFERKIFVSRADGLAILLIKGSKKGSVSCRLELNPRKPSHNLEARQIESSYRVFSSHIDNIKTKTDKNTIIYRNRFSKAYPGSIHALEGIAHIIAEKGTTNPDGEALVIKGADQVLVYIDIEMIYDPENSKTKDMIHHISDLPTDYNILLKRHTKIHGDLFNRMKLDLGGGKDHKLTTEQLLEKSTNQNLSKALLEKEFDAARYNIISCTGELPPTLQGIWGGIYSPPWASDFTHNGNVPSAMASVLMVNMPELMLAYTSYMESIVPYLEINAKHMFGARGIVLPSRSSTHGFNNALAKTFAGGFWVGGAAWASHFFYDYYLYTGDKQFLKEHALPFMEKTALFFEDYLYEGKDGMFIFSPTQSPENTPGNSDSQGSFNATMDIAAAKELLTNLMTASKELKVNRDKIPLWNSMLKKMPSYMIDKQNRVVKEWTTPKLEEHLDHRHSSQLYGLFYGMPEEIAKRPDLQGAFKKIIEVKLDKYWQRSGYMSFGLVQLGQAATSLGEAELAYQCLTHLVNRFWLNNLASMHNHRSLFNMDISGGMPAVIIKMLVASKPGKIKLLPALPLKWIAGSVEGILCRGQIEIKSLNWAKNQITVSLLTAKNQNILLETPYEIKNISIQKGIGRIQDGEHEMNRNLTLQKGKELILDIKLIQKYPVKYYLSNHFSNKH